MDFSYTKEQQMIANRARELSQKFGPDYWYEQDNDDNSYFPVEFFDALAKADILGLGIPRKYGGSGMGLTELVIAINELGAGGGGVAPSLICLLGVTFGGMSILSHGIEDKKMKNLPGMAEGRIRSCLGLTEPDAGTDTLSTSTLAEKDGDGYVINGNKIFISGVEDAEIMVLVTRTTKREDSPKKTLGMSLFIVDLPNDAIKYNSIPKHGMNFAKTYELGIHDLRVPKEALLGEEGKGWYHVLDTLNPERILVAAGGVGCGQLAIKTAAKYAGERKALGRPIGANQGIQFPLASAYAKIECAKLAVLKAAHFYDTYKAEKKVGDISNIAKFASVEAAIEGVCHAMQSFGEYGFAKAYHIERWSRDLQVFRVAPIAQQLTLSYISEYIMGMPKSY